MDHDHGLLVEKARTALTEATDTVSGMLTAFQSAVDEFETNLSSKGAALGGELGAIAASVVSEISSEDFTAFKDTAVQFVNNDLESVLSTLEKAAQDAASIYGG